MANDNSVIYFSYAEHMNEQENHNSTCENLKYMCIAKKISCCVNGTFVITITIDCQFEIYYFIKLFFFLENMKV